MVPVGDEEIAQTFFESSLKDLTKATANQPFYIKALQLLSRHVQPMLPIPVRLLEADGSSWAP